MICLISTAEMRGFTFDIRNLTKLKKSMNDCCTALKIEEGSLLHCQLIYDIIKFTAYHKRHVNTFGRVNIWQGNNMTDEFLSILDLFLDKKRIGVEYFPENVVKKDWKTPSYPERHERVRFTKDKETITANIGLMFENVKNNSFYASHPSLET